MLSSVRLTRTPVLSLSVLLEVLKEHGTHHHRNDCHHVPGEVLTFVCGLGIFRGSTVQCPKRPQHDKEHPHSPHHPSSHHCHTLLLPIQLNPISALLLLHPEFPALFLCSQGVMGSTHHQPSRSLCGPSMCRTQQVSPMGNHFLGYGIEHPERCRCRCAHCEVPIFGSIQANTLYKPKPKPQTTLISGLSLFQTFLQSPLSRMVHLSGGGYAAFFALGNALASMGHGSQAVLSYAVSPSNPEFRLRPQHALAKTSQACSLLRLGRGTHAAL